MSSLPKNIILRWLFAHHRLLVCILLGILAALLGPRSENTSRLTQALVGYDVAAIVYIFWALDLMYRSTQQQLRRQALIQDDGKIVILILVSMALIFSLSAIFAELAQVGHLSGAQRYETLLLAVTTIVASWFFTHVVFALHYAHDYYASVQRGRAGGLVFLPENEEPDYFDFLYFSFVIGATAQTADVTLASKKMRRTCLLHSILSFAFNTSLLAMTVNMASGLSLS